MTEQKSSLEMHFEARGKGLPVLFIHGFPLSSAIWQPQLAALKEEGHLIAPDLRGFGQSPASPPPYSVDMLAEDCVSLLGALDVERPAVVVGHSMGGYVALAIARLFPERLGGLVLVSTRAGADSPDGKAGRDKSIEDVKQQGPQTLLDSMHGKVVAEGAYQENPELDEQVRKAMSRATVEGIVGSLAAMRDRPDSSQKLPELQVPALLVHGLEDRIFNYNEAEDMAKSIPDAQLELLEGVGHLPSLEASERFNQVLAGFLAKF